MNYSVNKEQTLYAITFRLNKDTHAIPIGKLGQFNFQQGYYVYVGSAKRNITARIDRHLRIDKKMRWHIDYLRPYLTVESVQSFPEEDGECKLYQHLKRTHHASTPVKGFGSSDCKCDSHLFYYEKYYEI